MLWHPPRSLRALREIKKRFLVSHPLGNSNEFNRPVILSTIKRTNQTTLTTQSLRAFSFSINLLNESFISGFSALHIMNSQPAGRKLLNDNFVKLSLL